MDLEKIAKDLIKSFEGFTPKAMWDVNAYRIGYGTDTIELPNGTHRKVLKTDVTTEFYAEKDLQRRVSQEFIPRTKGQIGEPYWSNLPVNAKAALVSLAYNYGSITKPPIIVAAKSGDVNKLAKAIVDSTYNDNQNLTERVRNALRERRRKEAEFAKSGSDIKSEVEKFTKENWLPITLSIGFLAAALWFMYKYKDTIIKKL